MTERTKFSLIIGVFLVLYFIPVDLTALGQGFISGVTLLQEYARQHVLTCLVPAFFIAGAIAVFVKQDWVLKYLSGKDKPWRAYTLASVSGALLAVCSCTILPLFAGIWKRGAGLGPAVTFLFSGPAINVGAIFLTASVLGFPLGLARGLAAIALSILIGFIMHWFFKGVNSINSQQTSVITGSELVVVKKSALILFFGSLVGILVVNGISFLPVAKYSLIGFLVAVVIWVAMFSFSRNIRQQWLQETWSLTKLLAPVLFIGVFIVGFIMPFLPESLISDLVGNSTLSANFIAGAFGVLMYFSTLTEVPIVQALMAKGMVAGPALTLLLAGPALSLPSMLVIRKVLGNTKTAVYVGLALFFSSFAGFIYGLLV